MANLRLFLECALEQLAAGRFPGHGVVLRVLEWWVSRAPPSLVEYLPALVDVLVRVMDPGAPAVREVFYRPAVAILFSMVPKFPMVSLGANNTRMAVGSHDGHVVIFDLKACSQVQVRPLFGALLGGGNGARRLFTFFPFCTWRQSMTAFSGPVTALAFANDAKRFAAYSLVNKQLVVYQVCGAALGGGGPRAVCAYQWTGPDGSWASTCSGTRRRRAPWPCSPWTTASPSS